MAIIEYERRIDCAYMQSSSETQFREKTFKILEEAATDERICEGDFLKLLAKQEMYIFKIEWEYAS